MFGYWEIQDLLITGNRVRGPLYLYDFSLPEKSSRQRHCLNKLAESNMRKIAFSFDTHDRYQIRTI